MLTVFQNVSSLLTDNNNDDNNNNNNNNHNHNHNHNNINKGHSLPVACLLFPAIIPFALNRSYHSSLSTAISF